MSDCNDLAELQNALLRARAMGFDQTADAMQSVLNEFAEAQRPFVSQAGEENELSGNLK